MRIRITRATVAKGSEVAGVGEVLSTPADLSEAAAARLVAMGKAVVVADDPVGTVQEAAAPKPVHATKSPRRTR